MRSIQISLILFFIAISYAAKADVKLPAIFNDGMVLQQKSDVSFWGWAKPGEKVTLSGSWNSQPVSVSTDKTGRWQANLKTPSYGGPFEVRVKGENTILLKDVLIGEVWLCSGQSNMVFPLKLSENAEAEIAAADFPQIRFFNVKRQQGGQKFEDVAGSFWQKTSPQVVANFSAVGYFFAKKIYEELHVPVGIIFSAWGGTPAEAWTPSDVLLQNKGLNIYTDRWQAMMNTVGRDSVVYNQQLKAWQTIQNTPDSNKYKKPREPQTLFFYNRPWKWPGGLFNGMINPLIPFTIKGVLWYQGESNVNNDDYYELFSSMIKSWRAEWKKELPFYFVQIAPYAYGNLDAAARLRQAQYLASKKIPNTAMAVTCDIGDMNNLHPVKKKEVGERLAFIALARDYGKKHVVYKGPEVNSIIKEGNKCYVNFNQKVKLKFGQNPAGFEIGYKQPGKDSLTFVNAKTGWKDGQIAVWSDTIEKPAAVRYAWIFAGDGNLMNEAGLPVAPFTVAVK